MVLGRSRGSGGFVRPAARPRLLAAARQQLSSAGKPRLAAPERRRAASFLAARAPAREGWRARGYQNGRDERTYDNMSAGDKQGKKRDMETKGGLATSGHHAQTYD